MSGIISVTPIALCFVFAKTKLALKWPARMTVARRGESEGTDRRWRILGHSTQSRLLEQVVSLGLGRFSDASWPEGMCYWCSSMTISWEVSPPASFAVSLFGIMGPIARML